jgi:hypothetical protein
MTAHNPSLEPFALSPKETAQIERCGLTEVYRRINDGEYESYLDRAKRLITLRSIRARQQRLLAAASGPPQDNLSRRAGGPGRKKGSKNKPKNHSTA